MTIMTSKAVAAAIAAVSIALTVSACGPNTYFGPDPAACKAAMEAQYLKATAGQGHFGAALADCKGLPAAEMRLFAKQVQAGY